MKESTDNKIRSLALEDFPKEICGFIIKKGEAEICYPCKNISENPENRFIISPKEYLMAKEEGEILAIYHSHSYGTPPSEADKASCERTGVPWYVYSDEKMYELYPNGNKVPLLGRRFVWGVFDCFTLIQDYYKYNLDIILPDFEYSERFWEKGENVYLDNIHKAGFSRVEVPQENDVFLMQINSKIPNHAAVLVKGNKILHHMPNRLSCHDVYGGYWQFITMGTYRHEVFL